MKLNHKQSKISYQNNKSYEEKSLLQFLLWKIRGLVEKFSVCYRLNCLEQTCSNWQRCRTYFVCLFFFSWKERIPYGPSEMEGLWSQNSSRSHSSRVSQVLVELDRVDFSPNIFILK